MRLLLRTISFACLVLAVGLSVLDSIESVAESSVVMTSLGQVWGRFSPASLAAGLDAANSLPLAAWSTRGVSWSLAQPAFAVLLVLSLLAWIGGYKKVPAAGRFAA